MPVKSSKLAVGFGFALLVACASVPLTPEAERVRSIDPGWANTCEFLTNEELTDASFGTTRAACAKRADASMKNRVAELGGNAYVVTQRLVLPCLAGGTTLIFDAYRCPEN